MRQQNIDRLKSWLRAAFIAVPIVYFLNFIYALFSAQSGGTFGDTFGAANAFFSGTALLMLVLAVVLQREELEVVKEERNDTRKLLEGQENINRMQETALRKQSFEQSFFALLSLIFQEKSRLGKPVLSQTNTASWKKTAKIRAVEALLQTYSNPEQELDPSSMDTYVSECGTVCRLITTAYYLVESIDFLPRTETVLYVSALRALLDVEIAHVWCFLSFVWETEDPRSGKAFRECHGVDFLEPRFREQATERLEVSLANFKAMEANKL